MKNLLIIYPHWHPANLAGVQRPRLTGNYLKDLGWQPYVVTVKEEYFEETPDPDFKLTFSDDFIVSRVKAFKLTKPRIIGDIGLRAYFQIRKEALKIIKEKAIDFIWIPIPSFYMALMGRDLYEKTKVPYGIDYIDPWVRDITNQNNLRAKVSQWFARKLEPIAVKKASLISGVSTPYYAPVIQRNFPYMFDEKGKLAHQHINKSTNLPFTHVGMPYGFDPNDHKIKLSNLRYPWKDADKKEANLKHWVYAGAFLPNSHILMDAFFKAIAQLRKEKRWDNKVRLWFIGTGSYIAKSIEQYAHDNNIGDIVCEKRNRFPFLHILNFLGKADAVMIVGSTEKHYTASKTYQSLLSQRPVISIFHYESSAVEVMQNCKADAYTIRYKPEMTEDEIVMDCKSKIETLLNSDEWSPDLSSLNQYSSKESARKLVQAIEKVT